MAWSVASEPMDLRRRKFGGDSELQTAILDRFGKQIQAWHGERPELEPEHRRAAAHAHAERTAKLIAFWIFKTLTYWLSSREPE
jgi:hypothetical protein